MSFPKLVSDLMPEDIEETWSLESAWSDTMPGRAYYDVHVSIIDEHETAAAVFKRFLGDGGRRILESGCGTGRWMAYFETLGNRAFGVDHTPAQLRFVKAHAPEFNVAAGDVLAVPFRDDSFDAVLSSYVAEHFEDGPGRALAEARRVLKPGGLLFLVVPLANPWRRLVVHPLLRLIWKLYRWRGGRLHFTEYHFRRPEVENAVRREGFELLESHPDDYYPPWSKGLYCDFSDVLWFVNRGIRRPYQFGRLGTLAIGLASHLPLWWYGEGILCVARCRE